MAPRAMGMDQTSTFDDLELSIFPDGGSGGLETAMQQLANQNVPPPWSPENPVFWIGVLLILATGGAFVSTHVKAGPLKGSVSV